MHLLNDVLPAAASCASAADAAADDAMTQGYLLQADHDALIAAADASNVLRDASIAVGLGESMGAKR